MSSQSLIVHIVSFNIPYPPDYGGVMDVFYKIAALRKHGVGIILHCFSYGRSRSHSLEKECLKVYYYSRNLNLFLLLRNKPFIVLSRENEKLLSNLSADKHPIIFEGLHSTAFISHPSLEGRLKIVRTHNIEHHYYRNLAIAEKNPLRKLYFKLEAYRLEKYEQNLTRASLLFPISPGDAEYYNEKYGKTLFVGPFHPSDACFSRTGKGNYILLHGDFSTPENNASGLYLLREVISKWEHFTIIAGKKPSRELYHAAKGMKHVRIIPNPTGDKMSELIMEAQICLLHATQRTGMKLKLINALYAGRHVIASDAVVNGTRLETLCNIPANSDEWIAMADKLMDTSFTEEICKSRSILLHEVADNSTNALRIIESINNYNVHP